MPHNAYTKELSAALSSKKIAAVTDAELMQTLIYCMLVAGIRAATMDAIGDVEQQILIAFIRENYSAHTLSELKLAFKKAASGDLDANVTTYENFSCEYVGRIMKAYRTWASVKYNEGGFIQKQTLPVQLPPPQYHPLQLAQMFYEDFLAGAINADLIPARAFEIAAQQCEIVLTEAEMLKIVRQARTYVVQQYEMQKYSKEKLEKLKALPLGESCNDEYVNRYCKALALLQWFEQQKNAGITNLTETYGN